MCLDWLKSLICTYEGDIDPPNELEVINSIEVHTILQAACPNTPTFISDMNYKTTSKEELMRFLAEDLVDTWRYVPEYYDCDDFSFALMGNISNPDWGALPFGILWANTPNGGHAINCFIDKNRDFWVIEPQNDAIFPFPNDWTPWLVVM